MEGFEDSKFDHSNSLLFTDGITHPHSMMSPFEINESKTKRNPPRPYVLIAVVIYLILLTCATLLLAYQVFVLQDKIQRLQQAEGTPPIRTDSESLFNDRFIKDNTIKEDDRSYTTRASAGESTVIPEDLSELDRKLNTELCTGSEDTGKIKCLEEEIKIVRDKYDGLWRRIENISLTPGPPGLKGSKGDAGLSGLPGYKGEAGPRGEQGIMGAPGMKGEQGSPGRNGEQGVMGHTGPAGVPGSKGEKGDPGEKGVNGENGLPGQKGEKGDLGEKGSAGAPGASGHSGSAEKGEKGDPGTSGAQGVPGIEGPPGAKGDTGLTGLPGPKGTKGDQGIAGTQGQEGAVGRQGDTGIPGQKGEPGEKGADGAMGPPGVPGLQGAKGEMGTSVPVDPPVRLVGSRNQGRIEVRYNGEWGTICDDQWDIDDGHVVCRMLGFTRAVRIFVAPAGTGKILLDDVKCTGQEDSIYDCPKPAWGKHNCNHSEDAGVQCE